MTLEQIRSRHGDRQRPLAAPSQLRRQASHQTTSATTAQNGADIAMAFAIPSTGRSGASAFNPDPYFIGRTDVPPGHHLAVARLQPQHPEAWRIP